MSDPADQRREDVSGSLIEFRGCIKEEWPEDVDPVEVVRQQREAW